ncbi:uncharacterized protein LOC112346584 isoform X2 [Selaginella moellendorffii]|uniref:uncharacterized protein LOC112346584 isoform X2 n=1 Tax=Selaginella moellendorffii TaxID=88036 RepID=UPI000D1C8E57|nr:uncharacterized protein LOC112346584 isoform X2 [Selaginella moellendorffii]|eukprot:XP_024531647.1 uncharacterized protein LOC112346584 isoform X2 [Selaginella moellendorffii]
MRRSATFFADKEVSSSDEAHGNTAACNRGISLSEGASCKIGRLASRRKKWASVRRGELYLAMEESKTPRCSRRVRLLDVSYVKRATILVCSAEQRNGHPMSEEAASLPDRWSHWDTGAECDCWRRSFRDVNHKESYKERQRC